MKLTAQDLQIGDWVLTLESTHKEKVYAQIWAIEEGQTSILVKKDICNWFVDIEWIEPIPITPEILENNGFKKLNEGRFLLEDLEDNYWVKFYPKDTNYTHGSYDYIDLNSGCVSIREMPIKYVHQLQQAMRLCGIKGKEIEL